MDNKEKESLLEKASREILGNELKIIEEYSKAFIACKLIETGKELIDIFNDYTLNIKHESSGLKFTTKYWFSLKKEEEDE